MRSTEVVIREKMMTNTANVANQVKHIAKIEAFDELIHGLTSAFEFAFYPDAYNHFKNSIAWAFVILFELCIENIHIMPEYRRKVIEKHFGELKSNEQ